MNGESKSRFFRLVLMMTVAIGIVGPLAAAYACTAGPFFRVDAETVKVGQMVTGFGSEFSAAPGASAVEFRWARLNGPIVWSGQPDAKGNFNFSFEAPKSDPGQITLIAMQRGADGKLIDSTPARSMVEVVGPAGERQRLDPSLTAVLDGSPVSSPGFSAWPVAGLIGVGVLVFALAGAAALVSLRDRKAVGVGTYATR